MKDKERLFHVHSGIGINSSIPDMEIGFNLPLLKKCLSSIFTFMSVFLSQISTKFLECILLLKMKEILLVELGP